MKHPHAEFIAEALKDTSRDIQGRIAADKGWLSFTITEVVDARGGWQFRFADTKPECVSPLSDDELYKLWERSPTPEKSWRAVANAAHLAAYKQVAELPAVTSLSGQEIYEIFRSEYSVSESLRKVANAAIAEFQRTLLKQLGDVN